MSEAGEKDKSGFNGGDKVLFLRAMERQYRE
jgi:hypothetical protein